MLTLDTATYLGPARAIEIRGRHVRVEFPDGESAEARLAMPYVPAAGDELLVLRLHGDDLYAVGILEGRGELHFEASHITLESPHVEVRAGKFEIAARRILERARDVYRWVSDLLRVEAHRMHTATEKEFRLHAGDAAIKARADVNIDGRSINLG